MDQLTDRNGHDGQDDPSTEGQPGDERTGLSQQAQVYGGPVNDRAGEHQLQGGERRLDHEQGHDTHDEQRTRPPGQAHRQRRQAATFPQLVPERMLYDVLLRHRPSSWLDGRFSIALTGLTVIAIIAVVSTQRQSLGEDDRG